MAAARCRALDRQFARGARYGPGAAVEAHHRKAGNDGASAADRADLHIFMSTSRGETTCQAPPLHRRKLTRRKLLGGAAAGVAAASVPSFLPRSVGASTGHSLRMRSRYDIATLDPYRMVNRAEYDILSAATEKLVEIKPGKKWDWELGTACEEIEYIDETHVRFRLVEGRPWTNGFGTVSAHDVKFSIERILAEDAVVSPEWVGFSHVEVIDELERGACHRRPDGDAVHVRRALARWAHPVQEGDGEHRRRHLYRHSARHERPL